MKRPGQHPAAAGQAVREPLQNGRIDGELLALGQFFEKSGGSAPCQGPRPTTSPAANRLVERAGKCEPLRCWPGCQLPRSHLSGDDRAANAASDRYSSTCTKFLRRPDIQGRSAAGLRRSTGRCWSLLDECRLGSTAAESRPRGQQRRWCVLWLAGKPRGPQRHELAFADPRRSVEEERTDRPVRPANTEMGEQRLDRQKRRAGFRQAKTAHEWLFSLHEGRPDESSRPCPLRLSVPATPTRSVSEMLFFS